MILAGFFLLIGLVLMAAAIGSESDAISNKFIHPHKKDVNDIVEERQRKKKKEKGGTSSSNNVEKINDVEMEGRK